MFHRRIREERHARGLTQQELSRRAGIPRSQLQKLEQGDNVTLSTIQKTVGQLTGLRLELVPETVDLAEVQRTAAEVRRLLAELSAATEQLIAAANGAPAAATAGPLPGSGGATRHEAGHDPVLMNRLQEELEQAEREEARGEEH